MSSPLLIFGAAGTLTADVEETLRRLGLPQPDLLMNRDGPARVLDPARLRPPAATDRGARFLCPLFTPANRRAAVAEALALGLEPAAPVVDPTAILAASTTLAEGCFLNAGCIIGAAGDIGAFVLINRGASLGHHAEVAEFASIGPGAVIAGEVSIGRDAMIGAGAVVAPRRRIGEGSVVAPGAVVLRDVPPGMMAIGNPARLAQLGQDRPA